MTEPHAQALAGILPYLIPEMILGALACLVFLGGTVRGDRHLWGSVALAGLVAALVALHFGPGRGIATDDLPVVPGLFDSLANSGRVLAYAGGIVFVLFGWHEFLGVHAADCFRCRLVL